MELPRSTNDESSGRARRAVDPHQTTTRRASVRGDLESGDKDVDRGADLLSAEKLGAWQTGRLPPPHFSDSP